MTCSHLDHLTAVEPATPDGCQDCLITGDTWIHLRLCMDCGHVGCCDSSPNKHAAAHATDTDHPVIQSFEPDEKWAFCFIDQATIRSVEHEIERSYNKLRS